MSSADVQTEGAEVDRARASMRSSRAGCVTPKVDLGPRRQEALVTNAPCHLKPVLIAEAQLG
jgi:hypothetical protein